MKRRDFCQVAGLAAGSAFVPSLVVRSALAASRKAQEVGFRLQVSTTNRFRLGDLVIDVDGYPDEGALPDLQPGETFYWRVTDDRGEAVDLLIAHNYGSLRTKEMLPHFIKMYSELTLPWVIGTYGGSAVATDHEVTLEYELGQNYPNPFSAMTTIPFALESAGPVQLRVVNVLGQEVATIVDGELASGKHEVTWDAAGVASGTYFCLLKARSFRQTRQMIILK